MSAHHKLLAELLPFKRTWERRPSEPTISRKEFDALFRQWWALVARELVKGERVNIPGIATLKLRKRKRRKISLGIFESEATTVVPAQYEVRMRITKDFKKLLKQLATERRSDERGAALHVQLRGE